MSLAVLGLALTVAAMPLQAANLDCTPDVPFETVRKDYIQTAGRIPAVPVTNVLPSNGTGQFVLRQSLTEANAPRLFRAYETNGLDLASFKGNALPILSVRPVPDKLIKDFNSTDSVLLDVQIATKTFPLWHYRSFVILACTGGKFSGWAAIRARVSSPWASNSICLVVAVLVYLLAMTSVWLSRRTPHALVAKYPAIFGAKQLSARDFLNPIHLTTDAFGHGSVQKFQVLLFSFLVGWLVLSLVLETGALVDLSPTIVGLLGISGIGAATAQVTYQQKTRLSFENWAWLNQKGVLNLPLPANSPGPRWRDLVLTNREFDVYKLQTIIFSVAVAFALLFAGGSDLVSFSVPGTLLGILGLSQVVYVGGILVRPPAVDDLDQAVTKLRQAGEKVAAAKVQGTDTDANGNLLPTLPPDRGVAANAQRQYDDLADNLIPMIESTLEVDADRHKL